MQSKSFRQFEGAELGGGSELKIQNTETKKDDLKYETL